VWLVPILQPETYHHFADGRSLLGVPNFWNVVSSLAFLAVGAHGLAVLKKKPSGAVAAWATLFAGTALIGPGSAYYHWAPSDATLVWDRAPMAIAFGGFFAALVQEHTGRRFLPVFVILSLAAVWWWRTTGDLSAWVVVQAAPMLGILLSVSLLRGAYSHRRYFLYGFACYAVAKLVEIGDYQLMQWTSVSGHTLKHLAAAAAVWCFAHMLQLRK
jgi:hypothetical protein